MGGAYTIHDLESLTGLPRRTIRYYRSLGILPPASGTGRTATYGPEHLRRLREVGRTRDERVTLADLAERYSDRPEPA